jgi:hypothetical protein
MKRRLALGAIQLVWLGPLALTAGCSTGPQVRADFDPQADFSRYASFGFADPLGTDRSGYQTLVSQYLKEATQRELLARGLHYSASAPDLLVNFNARLSEKMRVMQSPAPYYAYGAGYYRYRGGMYTAWPMYYDQTTVVPYSEGTLNIDIVDRARGQMVWEGVAVGTVTDKALDNIKAAIDAAVTATFTKFPVAAKTATPAR